MKKITCWLTAMALTGALGFSETRAYAQTETALYSFTGATDGAEPYAGLVIDKKGNLYGTTSFGGNTNLNDGFGFGTVFKLDSSGNETVLYSFTGGADGAEPYAGLVMDKKGNLYGTTYHGGGSNAGVVFKLAPPYGQSNETVLYTFSGGADGANPDYGSLIMDKKGNLYGTAYDGGVGYGVVFKLAPPYGQGSETVLYTFQDLPGGAHPSAGLIMDKQGNLYGTTYDGGSSNAGVVFKLASPYGQGSETVLYNFGGGADGGYPNAGVIMDKQGNLYGTTEYGGSAQGFNGLGVVFKLASPYGQHNETVLYSFTGGAGGANPIAGVIMDKKGNLYGTASDDGNTNIINYGAGLVFKLAPPYGQINETALYSFTGGTDGANPAAGLIMDKKGNLYGTTFNGGDESSYPYGYGVVFKLTP